MLGRHLQVFVHVTDGFNQQTFSRVAGNDDRAGIPAFEHGLARIDPQAAFDFFRIRTMALVTTFGKNGADFLLEELDLFRGEFDCGFRRLIRVHR